MPITSDSINLAITKFYDWISLEDLPSFDDLNNKIILQTEDGEDVCIQTISFFHGLTLKQDPGTKKQLKYDEQSIIAGDGAVYLIAITIYIASINGENNTDYVKDFLKKYANSDLFVQLKIMGYHLVKGIVSERKALSQLKFGFLINDMSELFNVDINRDPHRVFLTKILKMDLPIIPDVDEENVNNSNNLNRNQIVINNKSVQIVEPRIYVNEEKLKENVNNLNNLNRNQIVIDNKRVQEKTSEEKPYDQRNNGESSWNTFLGTFVKNHPYISFGATLTALTILANIVCFVVGKYSKDSKYKAPFTRMWEALKGLENQPSSPKPPNH